MALDSATRSELLTDMIKQLQDDHDRAIAVGNTSAAIAASKAIAELLQLKLSPETADNAPFGVTIRQFTPVTDLLHAQITPLVERISELEVDGATPDEILERVKVIADQCGEWTPAMPLQPPPAPPKSNPTDRH